MTLALAIPKPTSLDLPVLTGAIQHNVPAACPYSQIQRSRLTPELASPDGSGWVTCKVWASFFLNACFCIFGVLLFFFPLFFGIPTPVSLVHVPRLHTATCPLGTLQSL